MGRPDYILGQFRQTIIGFNVASGVQSDILLNCAINTLTELN